MDYKYKEKGMKALLRIMIIINVLCAEKIYSQNNAIFGGGSSDGFAVATVGSSGSEVPLPIQLLSFTGKCEDKNIVLEWSTASVTNNDYFTLERSKDAILWKNVCHVKGA